MLANAITLSRLFFLALAVILLHVERVPVLLFAFFLIIFTILIDAFDGMVARRRGSTSPLGSVLDIAIDRVVENVFWITFVSLELVPLWVALVVVTRGILTDAVRGFAMGEGSTPFEMMETTWGRWLVSHRFMRALYGVTKAVTFPALALVQTLRVAGPASPFGRFFEPLSAITFALVLVTVATNLLRGIPVLMESSRFFVRQHLEKVR
ncbi:MAG: CDP-alcohol phosphatidyltransferase family protein [Chloroflexi bacterium]|jgi:CDP-diacylglycerol--glycerol-3-phosphate 3-phosphatidyltransferase|nr:CDP-alcohol phosphatidyltransferase family protein [Chloroflexota bacterium]